MFSLGTKINLKYFNFAMSVLKRMTGTDNFLGLPVGQKECQIETFEACLTKSYVKSVQSQCGCIPWALSSALNLKKPPFCSPDQSDCYKAVSRNITGCMVSCTGLYADVMFTEDRLLHADPIAKGNKNIQNVLYCSIFQLLGKKWTGRS